KKKRVVTVRLGRRDKAGKKLYATSEDWPRINEVGDALAEVVLDRSPLDFRGKKLFDFSSQGVEKVSVTRLDLPALRAGAFSLLGGAPGLGRLGPVAALAGDRTTSLTLARGKDGWGLTVPVSTEADVTRVDDLTGKVAGLEVVKFVSASATPAELEKKYGLGVPALRATLT